MPFIFWYDVKKGNPGKGEYRMANIRPITEEHFDESMALMQFAFQMQMPAERLQKLREEYRPEQEYGLFGEDGKLLTRLSVLPLDVWIGGSKLAMGGVAGVASWPDARRQGGVRRLLQHAFSRMREDGQSISMLAPFSFAFYRKFGYESTIERKQYTLETKHLPRSAGTPGSVKIVSKDMASLDSVYSAYASQFDGMLARDAQWWERSVLSKPGIAAVYSDENGQPQGYMLYEVSERTLKVHDWATVTEDARRALWTYAANHDSMIKQLTITVPTDDPLAFLVEDPRFKQEIQPYFMSRIIDAEAFVAQYRFVEAGEASEVALTIADTHAPWNEGNFALRIEADGSARLARDAGGGGLQCDIRTLTAMLVGDRRPAWLHRVGRLQGSAEQALELERRVPVQRPFLADFF